MKTQEYSQFVVEFLKSDSVGPCDSCKRYSYGNQMKSHFVYQVFMHGSSFRLCPNCKDELVAKLKKLEP